MKGWGEGGDRFLLQETRREDMGQVEGYKSVSVARRSLATYVDCTRLELNYICVHILRKYIFCLLVLIWL